MALRVLLTGHNGYMGAALGTFLQACGHVVVGLDTGYFRECAFGAAASPLPCLWKDVRDVDSDFLRRFDAVIHLAAISVPPEQAVRIGTEALDAVNRKAAVRLARLARKAGARRFVFASADPSAHERADMAELKAKAETGILELADDTFTPVCLRVPEVYGFSPQFRADLPVNRMACDAFTTGSVTLPLTANATRAQFAAIHVEDAAAAFVCSLVAPAADIRARTFAMGLESGVLSYRAIANAVREVMPDVVIETQPDNYEQALTYVPRLSLAHEAMPGCRPQWSVQSGIRQIVDAFCRRGFAPEDRESRRFNRGPQLDHLLSAGEIQPDLTWKRNFGEELATWAA